jgi:hypothetical protein
MIKNIAMWSGPRNLSTAMMYSFASRTDCHVVDEPFYAAYLSTTGIKHAMYKEIINDGVVDPKKVIERCINSEFNGQQEHSIFYQKHMTKHMIPSIDRSWIGQVCNVFLIREPAKVIASYHAKDQDPGLSDIGVVEQCEIFDRVCQKIGKAPTVIDSWDILNDPKKMLSALCKAINIDFQENMLSWPTGPRSFDGIWAPHWYKSVWQSNGFSTPSQKKPKVPDHLLDLLDTANSYYDQLKGFALKGNA